MSWVNDTWSTPSAADWQHIKTLARRAFRVITWAADALPAEEAAKLKLVMFQLLQDLVHGHFRDRQLDFTDILTAGLSLMLTQWCMFRTYSPALNILALSLIQRLIQDEMLSMGEQCVLSDDEAVARHQQTAVVAALFGKPRKTFALQAALPVPEGRCALSVDMVAALSLLHIALIFLVRA